MASDPLFKGQLTPFKRWVVYRGRYDFQFIGTNYDGPIVNVKTNSSNRICVKVSVATVEIAVGSYVDELPTLEQAKSMCFALNAAENIHEI